MLQTPPTKKEIASIERLIAVAKRDTGQSREVASLLLAWYNAATYGGFDLTDLWGVDDDIALDMTNVIEYVARSRHYPDALGFDEDFQQSARLWRQQI